VFTDYYIMTFGVAHTAATTPHQGMESKVTRHFKPTAPKNPTGATSEEVSNTRDGKDQGLGVSEAQQHHFFLRMTVNSVRNCMSSDPPHPLVVHLQQLDPPDVVHGNT
jgi:hypothetical protein